MAASKNLGRVHVITGPGKGKTTAAFGLALRAAGHGLRVCVIQFLKTGMTTGEVLAMKRFPGFQVHQFGTGRFLDPKRITEDDKKCAQEAVAMASSILVKGGCDLLVLDEISVAAAYGLVDVGEVLSIVNSRKPWVEVVLTGRDAPKEFIDLADYVSYIDDRKHPFKKGLKGRKGIEW